MKFYVYEHWRLDTDTCFYVGKGSGDRAYRKNRNSHWQNIVAKLERTGFAYEIRIVASNLTEQEAFDLEHQRIVFWRDIVDLANKTEGGEGCAGLVHSDETRNKIRQNTPVKRGENHPMYGRKRPDNAERNMSRKGIKNPNMARKGKNHPAYGKPRAEETKARISQANKYRKFTDDHRRKLSEAAKMKFARIRAEKLAQEI